MSNYNLTDEFNSSSTDWSEELKQAIHIAKEYAKESYQEAIMPAHLLKALLHNDIELIPLIEQLEKDYYYLLEWAEIQIEFYPKTKRVSDELNLSDTALASLREADNFRLRLNIDRTTPACLLAALATPGVGFTYEQLKTLMLTSQEVFELVDKTPKKAGKRGISTGGGGGGSSPAGSSKAISKYCINKNELVEEGLINQVIGFENEISILFEVLGRKTKSNLLITGESGVGKTALVNGFVQRLVASDVPGFLDSYTVYELNLAAVTSDANYKGEAEDRLKNVVEEMKKNDNSILLI